MSVARRKQPLPLPTEFNEAHLQQKRILYRLLVAHFSADELESLAFYLGIDSDELGEGAKSVRIGRLIDMAYHQQKAAMLIWRLKELRPRLDWQD